MRLWQALRRETAGTFRSIRYDMRVRGLRLDRRTHWLVTAAAMLAVLVAASFGALVKLTGSHGDIPANRSGVTGGSDLPPPHGSDSHALPGIGGATGATAAASILPAPVLSSETTAASPTRSPSATRTPPPRPRPMPTGSSTSVPPSFSPTPSESGSLSPSGSITTP